MERESKPSFFLIEIIQNGKYDNFIVIRRRAHAKSRHHHSPCSPYLILFLSISPSWPASSSSRGHVHCTRCRAVAARLPNPIFERFPQLWSVAPSFTRRHRSTLIILHHAPYFLHPLPSSGDRMMMTMFISRSFHYKLISDSQQGQSKLGCGNIGKVEIGTWETAVLRLEAMCYFFIIELKDK